MLKLKKVKKSYKTGAFTQHALKNIDLEFRNNEFVAVLGPSGSGKTTLLNIIGGLDNYDAGDLIINGKSTKHFKAPEWDAYRNNSVGFIFQSYNLIPHISILENVEIGMTLSGINSKERKKKAEELLKKVGLKEHIHKKPNQLSGGQMQRVAIARALANDPDIILADEPTGALDTKTSKQIMNLIKDISREKLVIMVTHNPELADEYATRIIGMKDGEIINDNNPLTEEENENHDFSLKKTSMNFLTALKLSFNNIKTKKGRTALTAFASSIGIIGIALILSLSNGFKIEVDTFEQNSLAQSPIVITKEAMKMDENTIKKLNDRKELKKYPTVKKIYAQDDIMNTVIHTNNFTKEYLDYLDKIDKNKISGITYEKGAALNIIRKEDNSYKKVEMPSNDVYQSTQLWSLLPSNPNENEDGVIEINYDVIAGKLDENTPGLILQVNNKNQISATILEQLGFKDEEIDFKDILNKEYKIATNDDYYQKIGNNFVPTQDYQFLYNSEKSITVKVIAIIRGKDGKEMVTNTSGLGYNKTLLDRVISINKNSKIVKAQEELNYNILTHLPFDDNTNTKDIIMGYLGAESYPVAIYLYPKDFDTKDYVTEYLDKYNKGKNEKDTIQYTDTAKMISSLTGGIMDAITIVLVAFSSISLVVSSIMIGIITYISVLERIKEIGILRALGARKKDIKRVFNAETFIIGIFSGLLGIGIAYLLTFPTNIIIENLSGLANVAKLNPVHAIVLIIISMSLTIIGGAIPATIASRKDPVDALRTE